MNESAFDAVGFDKLAAVGEQLGRDRGYGPFRAHLQVDVRRGHVVHMEPHVVRVSKFQHLVI